MQAVSPNLEGEDKGRGYEMGYGEADDLTTRWTHCWEEATYMCTLFFLFPLVRSHWMEEIIVPSLKRVYDVYIPKLDQSPRFFRYLSCPFESIHSHSTPKHGTPIESD